MSSDLLRQQDVLVLLQSVLDGVVEVRIANARTVESRKQIVDESEKQRNVVVDELGKIHVSKSAHQHHILFTVQTFNRRQLTPAEERQTPV